MSTVTRSTGAVALAAAPLLVAHLGLLATWDLAARPAAALGWLALGFAGLVWAVGRMRRFGAPAMPPILIVATLLRLAALPLPPNWSDDIYRYVWDGRVIGAGLNPYLVAPEAEEAESLRDDSWRRLPHRGVETVYPPLALTFFSIAARLPAPVLTLKILLAAADLVTCWLLVRIARRLDLAESSSIWYAWSPLPVLEVAGMGHVDALGVCAVAAVVLLLVSRPRRVGEAAVAAAAAVLAKLVPVLALPIWARFSGRPKAFFAIAAALVAAALLPVVAAAGGVPPGYVAFGVSWEFNGPLYEPLWRLVDRLEVTTTVTRALDWAKSASGRHELLNHLYPFNYPQFLAKLALAAAGLVALLDVWRRRLGVVESTGMIFAVLVLFSSTVYPWYLMWLLPWAALCRQPAWLVLSGTVLLSYWPQFTSASLMPWVFLAIWTPFFLTLVRYPRWRLESTG